MGLRPQLRLRQDQRRVHDVEDVTSTRGEKLIGEKERIGEREREREREGERERGREREREREGEREREKTRAERFLRV